MPTKTAEKAIHAVPRTGSPRRRGAKTFYEQVAGMLEVYRGRSSEDWQALLRSPEQLEILDVAKTLGNLSDYQLYGISETLQAIESTIRIWQMDDGVTILKLNILEHDVVDLDLPRLDGAFVGGTWDCYFMYELEEEDEEVPGDVFRQIVIELDHLRLPILRDLVRLSEEGWGFNINPHQAQIAPGEGIAIAFFRKDWLGGYGRSPST